MAETEKKETTAEKKPKPKPAEKSSAGESSKKVITDKAKAIADKKAKGGKGKEAGKEEAGASKATKTTKTTVVKKPIHKRHGVLYAKAIFTGYKRGQRNQHENTALLKVNGCKRKAHVEFYVGKKCVFLYKGKKKGRAPGIKGKTKVRAIWGKVTRPHGATGAVKAKFKRNLPSSAMGRTVRIMLYPSRI